MTQGFQLTGKEGSDTDVRYQTALASLTYNGADLTRVTLCGFKHALAIAHYVDEFEENCEPLRVVVTGVPNSGYSHIHRVEKVNPEPKSDPDITKEEDYRVAVITVSFTLDFSISTRISSVKFYFKIFRHNTIGSSHTNQKRIQPVQNLCRVSD